MKQVHKNFIISYILTDEIWWCKIIGFWIIPKITPLNLCKTIHDIMNYSASTCPFESGKCGREEEKIQKLE